jgi:DNA-binding MarR family transcriptional regulator
MLSLFREALMAYVLFNEETGVISDIKKKKIKRTEAFFMVDLASAEILANMKELHGADHRILWLILSRITYENTSLISQAFIAETLNMPKSQVSVSIAKMVARNVVRKINENGVSGFKVNADIADRGRVK